MDTPSRRSNASLGTPPRRSSGARRSGHYGTGGFEVDDTTCSLYEEGRPSEELARLSASSSHFSIAGPVHVPQAINIAADPALGYEAEFGRRFSVSREHQVTEDVDMDMEMGAFVLRKSLSARDPPLPIVLKFVDVRYKVRLRSPAVWGPNSPDASPLGSQPSNKFEKEILHGITGTVIPGEMLALMGPSGSGKTTLLNLLGGRIHANVSGSSVTYNDVPFCKPLQRRMGFVTQDDILFPHLTVKETLVYAAMLRLPKSLTTEGKIQRAEEIILELGLDRCRDTIIGGPFLRGVSGGERKRVCVGHEILIDPSMLFLDEPTSGLDSTTALRIVQVLQSIAQAGRTVVTTIHQPSSRLFYMFDKLILLAEGSPVYSGKAGDCMDYFDSIGFIPLLTMNPADFLLDLASGNVNDVSIPPALEQMALQTPNGAIRYSATGIAPPLAKDVLQVLIDSYVTFISAKETTKLLELGESKEELQEAISEKRVWSSSWWTQFSVLMVRGLKERRHEYLSTLRFVQICSAALVAGLLWWQSKHRTDKELQDQMGLLFFIALFWGFFPLFTAIFTFPQERAMLAKERNADMYRLSAYFMSRTLGDLPLDLVLPVIFLLIIYFMAHLRMTVEAFFLTMFSVFLNVITSQGVGFAIGACVMDVKKATTVASVLLLAFMLAGGYFVQYIPKFIRWCKYVSFNFYAYKLLVKVQYNAHETVNCESPQGCNRIADSPAFHGIQPGGGGIEVLALAAMVVIYRLMAYIALRRMKTNVA